MLRGMVAWEPDQRRSLNPSVGVRRQLPLHKGAVFAAQRTTIPFCGAGPGLQSSPYRVMVYHTRSTEAEQCIKPSASFGSSVKKSLPDREAFLLFWFVVCRGAKTNMTLVASRHGHSSLCLNENNWPAFCCSARERRLPAKALRRRHAAAASLSFGCEGSGPWPKRPGSGREPGSYRL